MPVSYLRPPEENAANRRWWSGLPAPIRSAVLARSGIDEAALGSDEVLARLCDVAMKGSRKENLLCDYHETRDHEGLVSERLRALLLAAGAAEDAFQPVTLLDQDDQPLAARYFRVQPPALDCLDQARSEPTYYPNYSFSEVKRLALDEARIPPATVMFAVKDMSNAPIVVRKAVADAIERAELTGLACKLPRR